MNVETKVSKKIKDRLEEKMGASAMDINVEYFDEFVRLSGFVDVLAEKTFAQEITKTVSSIKKINKPKQQSVHI